MALLLLQLFILIVPILHGVNTSPRTHHTDNESLVELKSSSITRPIFNFTQTPLIETIYEKPDIVTTKNNIPDSTNTIGSGTIYEKQDGAAVENVTGPTNDNDPFVSAVVSAPNNELSIEGVDVEVDHLNEKTNTSDEAPPYSDDSEIFDSTYIDRDSTAAMEEISDEKLDNSSSSDNQTVPIRTGDETNHEGTFHPSIVKNGNLDEGIRSGDGDVIESKPIAPGDNVGDARDNTMIQPSEVRKPTYKKKGGSVDESIKSNNDDVSRHGSHEVKTENDINNIRPSKVNKVTSDNKSRKVSNEIITNQASKTRKTSYNIINEQDKSGNNTENNSTTHDHPSNNNINITNATFPNAPVEVNDNIKLTIKPSEVPIDNKPPRLKSKDPPFRNRFLSNISIASITVGAFVVMAILSVSLYVIIRCRNTPNMAAALQNNPPNIGLNGRNAPDISRGPNQKLNRNRRLRAGTNIPRTGGEMLFIENELSETGTSSNQLEWSVILGKRGGARLQEDESPFESYNQEDTLNDVNTQKILDNSKVQCDTTSSGDMLSHATMDVDESQKHDAKMSYKVESGFVDKSNKLETLPNDVLYYTVRRLINEVPREPMLKADSTEPKTINAKDEVEEIERHIPVDNHSIIAAKESEEVSAAVKENGLAVASCEVGKEHKGDSKDPEVPNDGVIATHGETISVKCFEVNRRIALNYDHHETKTDQINLADEPAHNLNEVHPRYVCDHNTSDFGNILDSVLANAHGYELEKTESCVKMSMPRGFFFDDRDLNQNLDSKEVLGVDFTILDSPEVSVKLVETNTTLDEYAVHVTGLDNASKSSTDEDHAIADILTKEENVRGCLADKPEDVATTEEPSTHREVSCPAVSLYTYTNCSTESESCSHCKKYINGCVCTESESSKETSTGTSAYTEFTAESGVTQVGNSADSTQSTEYSYSTNSLQEFGFLNSSTRSTTDSARGCDSTNTSYQISSLNSVSNIASTDKAGTKNVGAVSVVVSKNKDTLESSQVKPSQTPTVEIQEDMTNAAHLAREVSDPSLIDEEVGSSVDADDIMDMKTYLTRNDHKPDVNSNPKLKDVDTLLQAEFRDSHEKAYRGTDIGTFMTHPRERQGMAACVYDGEHDQTRPVISDINVEAEAFLNEIVDNIEHMTQHDVVAAPQGSVNTQDVKSLFGVDITGAVNMLINSEAKHPFLRLFFTYDDGQSTSENETECGYVDIQNDIAKCYSNDPNILISEIPDDQEISEDVDMVVDSAVDGDSAMAELGDGALGIPNGNDHNSETPNDATKAIIGFTDNNGLPISVDMPDENRKDDAVEVVQEASVINDTNNAYGILTASSTKANDKLIIQNTSSITSSDKQMSSDASSSLLTSVTDSALASANAQLITDFQNNITNEAKSTEKKSDQAHFTDSIHTNTCHNDDDISQPFPIITFTLDQSVSDELTFPPPDEGESPPVLNIDAINTSAPVSPSNVTRSEIVDDYRQLNETAHEDDYQKLHETAHEDVSLQINETPHATTHDEHSPQLNETVHKDDSLQLNEPTREDDSLQLNERSHGDDAPQVNETAHQDDSPKLNETPHDEYAQKVNETEHEGDYQKLSETAHEDDSPQLNDTSHGGDSPKLNETAHENDSEKVIETAHGDDSLQINETSHEDDSPKLVETEHGGNYQKLADTVPKDDSPQVNETSHEDDSPKLNETAHEDDSTQVNETTLEGDSLQINETSHEENSLQLHEPVRTPPHHPQKYEDTTPTYSSGPDETVSDTPLQFAESDRPIQLPTIQVNDTDAAYSAITEHLSTTKTENAPSNEESEIKQVQNATEDAEYMTDVSIQNDKVGATSSEGEQFVTPNETSEHNQSSDVSSMETFITTFETSQHIQNRDTAPLTEIVTITNELSPPIDVTIPIKTETDISPNDPSQQEQHDATDTIEPVLPAIDTSQEIEPSNQAAETDILPASYTQSQYEQGTAVDPKVYLEVDSAERLESSSQVSEQDAWGSSTIVDVVDLSPQGGASVVIRDTPV